MATSSVERTASSTTLGGVQLIPPSARGGVLKWVMLHPGGAAASVTIYDNASAASGDILLNNFQAQTGWSNHTPRMNIPFKNGLWAVVAGAGASIQVGYE